MNKRLILCSDHIKKDFNLDDAIAYSNSRELPLEVHKKHFSDLFRLDDVYPIISIHPLWRDFSLCTNNQKYLKKSIEYLKTLIKFIQEKNIPHIVIHPEGYPADLNKNLRMKNVINAFVELSEYLESGINDECKILLENIPPAVIYPPSELPEYYIGEKLEDLIPILEINNNIEFLFDLGHFLCSYNCYGEGQFDVLKKLWSKLTYVHVHDNNGEINNHEPLTRPSSIKILRLIENNCHPKYSFEIRPSVKGLNNSIDAVKRIMNG
ncbi:MAG: TIM barrel protein [Candidatus Lokiarchaeota archaeon]|nr:TIM barrel protein [Candidatus Lokiarchaeota archaeon]